MFTVALWDRTRERLVLARDRVGKKPLLWTQLPDGSLAFASELKALLRLPRVSREVDPIAIDAYLALQYVPGGTGLQSVEKLPPGHILVAENGDVRVERYAQLDLLPQESEGDWLALVRERVEAAVRRRLISDVPLGALLSGGIDSSIVVSLMAQASTHPVRTFTICFGDERYDERRYARAVAERYATEHEEIELEGDMADALPRLAEAFDEPLGDDAALPLFLVCEAARQHVTVALTGDGGDESFAGYERYVAHELAGRLHVPGVGAAARALRSMGRERRSTAVRAARLLEAAASQPGERYGRLMEVFPAEARIELLDADFVPRPAPAWQLLGPPPADGIAGLQLLDIQTYLPGDLLLKADIASMAHSLELRSPLLDWDVLELGVSLPRELKTKGRRGKEALRRAFADDLPEEVAERRQVRVRRAARGLVPQRAAGPRRRRVARLPSAPPRPAAAAGGGAPARGPRRRPRRPCARALVPAHARAVAADASRHLSRRAAYLVVALVAIVPRLVVLLHERADILASFTEKSDRFARVFVDDGTFGFLPGEPSAWTQPLYSFFLIPIYWIAGREWWAVGFAQIAVAAATAIVVYEIGRRFLSHRAGLVAAIVATLSPYLVWHDVHVNRELLDQLLAALVVLLTLVVGERRGGLAAPALLGLGLGLAILGNSRLVLLPLVIAGYLLWRRKGWQTVGVTLAACVVALVPWLVRNEASVGCFTLNTDSRAVWKANNLETYDALAAGKWIDDVPSLPGAPPWPELAADLTLLGAADDGRRVRADAALPPRDDRLLAGAPRREGAAHGSGGANALGSAVDPDGGTRGRRAASSTTRARGRSLYTRSRSTCSA